MRIVAVDAGVLCGRRPTGTCVRRPLARIPAEPFRGIVAEPLDRKGDVFPGMPATQVPGHTDSHRAFLAGEAIISGDAMQCGHGRVRELCPIGASRARLHDTPGMTADLPGRRGTCNVF